jgi:hypothetical protein
MFIDQRDERAPYLKATPSREAREIHGRESAQRAVKVVRWEVW